jgi:hypothetical protein
VCALAVAVTASTTGPRRGPRAVSRRGFRHAAKLPPEPVGVEVLAAIKQARTRLGRVFEWDARLETSAIAVLAYLWRRGRGERWAGRHGSARFACSIAQLVIGLAPIMGWPIRPRRGQRDAVALARFVKAHRKSVQRWLDWLQLAGLISHTPQQDEEGFWWRTIIELHPRPELDPGLLEEAIDRRGGWSARERRRETRGRRRNLTAILRRARLTRAQRRARSAARRRALAERADRERVRGLVAASLQRAAQDTSDATLRSETTSRSSLENKSHPESFNRGLTGTRARLSNSASIPEAQTTSHEEGESPAAEDLRWAVYREVMAKRFAHTDGEWQPHIAASTRRIEQLLDWPAGQACPRWRLIECWTINAHGPNIAAAGGFRLAFWSEQREHHGARLERALARYSRYVQARPPGWPHSPIAALARFLSGHTPPQDGPEHGMAYDVQRFNELTKQMSAYAHYTRPEHLELAARRARRRQRLDELAARVNQRLRFRLRDTGAQALVRRASGLLDSQHPNHQAAGRAMYAHAQRAEQLAERDQRLLAGRHPGNTDGRYRAACTHAERWGLPAPPGRWNTTTTEHERQPEQPQ